VQKQQNGGIFGSRVFVINGQTIHRDALGWGSTITLSQFGALKIGRPKAKQCQCQDGGTKAKFGQLLRACHHQRQGLNEWHLTKRQVKLTLYGI
jgi:hypothetical protein